MAKIASLTLKIQKKVFLTLWYKLLVDPRKPIDWAPQFAIIPVLKLVYGLCLLAKRQREFGKNCIFDFKNSKNVFLTLWYKLLVDPRKPIDWAPQFAIIPVLKLVYGLCLLAKRQREFGKNCIFDFKNSKNVFLTLWYKLLVDPRKPIDWAHSVCYNTSFKVSLWTLLFSKETTRIWQKLLLWL